MPDLNSMLKNLQDVAENPKAMLDKYLESGKKVIGCFPLYTPAELVHAAGMVPMGIWGGQVNPSVAGQYAPIFICSIMRSCLEFGMLGKYKGLSAVIMPILCDTFRGMSGAWREGVKDIPLIALIPPQNRESTGAKQFLVDEYEVVRKRLEDIAGKKITDANLENSIKAYNHHSSVMREFCEVANKHLDVITPNVRHAVMKSALFMTKEEHSAIVTNIIKALNALPEHQWKGKKVVLTGITAEPSDLLAMFSENGVAVVGDDLAQESRQYRTDIPESDGTAMERLAQQWFDRKACPTIHETISSRGEHVINMARAQKADGVVACLMNFCDVDEYEYPMLVKEFEAVGLPSLCLNIDQSTENSGQSRTKIQTFVETM